MLGFNLILAIITCIILTITVATFALAIAFTAYAITPIADKCRLRLLKAPDIWLNTACGHLWPLLAFQYLQVAVSTSAQIIALTRHTITPVIQLGRLSALG